MDQRRFTQRAQRFALEIPIRYCSIGTVVWHEGKTVNISTSGILFRTADLLQPSTALNIALSIPFAIPDEAHVQIRCRGRLIRDASGAGGAHVFAVSTGRYRIVRLPRRSREAQSMEN